MTYVMSDVHGQYAKFLQLLDEIRFRDQDNLYILGDIVDRGPQPIELLTDLSMRCNVFPILGNHDLTAAKMLHILCAEITAENYATQIDRETLRILADWQADGGKTTLDGLRSLDADERLGLLDYLDEFAPYETLSVGGRRFILVHAGIPYDKRDLPLEEQIIGELLLTVPDYTRRYYPDAILVTGHTPTFHIDPAASGRIWQGNGHIALDCGAGFDMPLGCLRLEDMREFYVG